MSWGEWPILQIALDTPSMEKALRIAEEVAGLERVWLEVGTPLVMSEGMNPVRRLRRLFPEAFIVADIKIIDAGRLESSIAIEAGASLVTVAGSAGSETISEVVEACHGSGVKAAIDLGDAYNRIEAAERAIDLGIDMLVHHVGYDKQARGIRAISDLDLIRKLSRIASEVPVAAAGGIRVGEVSSLLKAGVKVVIVGRSITEAADPRQAARRFLEAMESCAGEGGF